MRQQAQHICRQKPSGEQCAGCTVACDGMFLWYVQEVAELEGERTSSVTQLLIHSYPQLLVESSLDHLVSYTTNILFVCLWKF